LAGSIQQLALYFYKLASHFYNYALEKYRSALEHFSRADLSSLQGRVVKNTKENVNIFAKMEAFFGSAGISI